MFVTGENGSKMEQTGAKECNALRRKSDKTLNMHAVWYTFYININIGPFGEFILATLSLSCTLVPECVPCVLHLHHPLRFVVCV